MHGARAAQTGATTELRASELEVIAEDPEKRRVRGDVHGALAPVDEETEGRHGDHPGEVAIIHNRADFTLRQAADRKLTTRGDGLFGWISTASRLVRRGRQNDLNTD